MSLSAIGQTQASRDVPGTKDPRAASDDPSATSFAAMLAGMTGASTRTDVPAPKSKEGTTELGAAAEGLAPGLKDRLARVITRMRDELGKTVSVNEGLRSQSRQDALFAQGRTTTGPVVTWTRNSMHGRGLAADLMIDGGYSDAHGFAELQRIAREEGLHTLGKMDPGHVELRTPLSTGEFVEGIGTKVASTDLPNVKMDARATQVAQVAQVASVAQVTVPTTARIARVAQVAHASVASTSVTRTHTTDAQPRGQQTNTRDDGAGRGDQGETRAPVPNHDSASGNLRAYAEMSRPDASRLGDDASVTSTSSISNNPAARVEQALDLQESRAPKVLSHLNLSLDNGEGGRDTVRIGMRGAEVGATFDMHDAAGATRISARLGELTSALERRGLEPQSFNVRHTGHSAELDAVTARATVLSSSESNSTRNDDQGGARGFNRHAPDRDDQSARRQDADERRRRNTMFSLTTEDA